MLCLVSILDGENVIKAMKISDKSLVYHEPFCCIIISKYAITVREWIRNSEEFKIG